MSLLTNLELMHRVPLFSMLTPAQTDHLVHSVTKKRFKRGQALVQQGQATQGLYILLNGRARVLMSDCKGREVILSTLGPGDYVGEMALIDNGPHSASVVADVQVDALVLGRDSFLRCLSENSALSFAVMYGLVQRLRRASDKISSLALVGVYGRVAMALLDAAEPDSESGMVVREKLPRQVLAKMVGASREMVTRVMRDFEEAGFIQPLPNGMIRVCERRMAPR